MEHSFAITMFGALFAVMNPFVNLPIFLSLTDGQAVSDQRKAAIQIVIYTVIMCAVVAVTGSYILSFFSISLDAFRLAGGLVLGHIGWDMLNGTDASSHHGSTAEKKSISTDNDIAFFPMTFPMLVGPGTIATLILYTEKADSVQNLMAYGVVVAAVIGIMGIVLWFAGEISHHLSTTMRVIMTRIMGMILIAIAAGMITDAAKVLLPGLSGAAGS